MSGATRPTRRRPAGRPARLAAALLAVLTAASALGACSSVPDAAPRCEDDQRLALVAQSVPSASYLPCITRLARGWSISGASIGRGRSRFTLQSDRSPGHPVSIQLSASCDIAGATLSTPRATSARTYLRLRSITPRYAGELIDVFPGGCVRYRFDFERGPHIGLLDDLERGVGLRSRNELRADLRRGWGIDLDPAR